MECVNLGWQVVTYMCFLCKLNNASEPRTYMYVVIFGFIHLALRTNVVSFKSNQYQIAFAYRNYNCALYLYVLTLLDL